ncbi:MAG: class II fructose-bisphosphatase [Caldilineae bacterium]|nr:MAG: class II fructose-bisphosphatase [Caldilineae bacterium]
MTDREEKNLGLELVRATEAAAMVAGRWMGLGERVKADQMATSVMHRSLNTIDFNGYIVIGEEAKSGLHSPLDTGNRVGRGAGPEMDVIVDPVDGTRLLVEGRSGAISVVAAAPRGSMWSPPPQLAVYMHKIVVDREVADALVPECMDAPAAWTLALIARVKGKEVRDLVVFILDRPRHRDLIQEIRQAGARVALRSEGDIAGAILAAMPQSGVDVLMGIGGVTEGITAACAVKALGGAMLGRLAPQSSEDRKRIVAAGIDPDDVLDCNRLVTGNEIFFAATGVTDGPLLDGVRYRSGRAETHSLVLRAETGTRRLIRAEHLLKED